LLMGHWTTNLRAFTTTIPTLLQRQ